MTTFELHNKLKALVLSERKITLEILQLIQILDISKNYLELGYHSLFDYLTRGIGYSEGSAQRRISSARLLKQIPQIEKNIKSGEINLSQIALAQIAISHQEKSEGQKICNSVKANILENLKSKNTFETKCLLQKALPKYDPLSKTQVNPNKDNVSVTLYFSQNEWSKIQEFLAVNSHKIPDQKIESLPLKLADRSSTSSVKTEKSKFIDSNKRVINGKKRSYICLKTRRQLLQKAKNRCEYVSPINLQRCTARHFLQIDHKVPVSLGGSCHPDGPLGFPQRSVFKSHFKIFHVHRCRHPHLKV